MADEPAFPAVSDSGGPQMCDRNAMAHRDSIYLLHEQQAPL